jgi:PTS system nitrogen regulatory IIA component
MTLDELIPADHVLFGLRAADKAALVQALARLAADALGLAASEIAAALAAREALGSTGTGRGIALPHARLAALAAPAGFLARLERPVNFDAVDGEPVDLAVLLLSPTADSEHLHALAAVARRLRNATVAQAMRAAASAAALRTALLAE